MIKKSILLAALISSLPLCADVKLETTVSSADEKEVVVNEFALSAETTSAKLTHKNTEFEIVLVDAQEDAATLTVIVSQVEENGSAVEHASRTIAAQWEQATEIFCDGQDVVLSVVPSRVA